ncbi:class I SAM-dependent methyltransferase [Novispirillum itersonii]|uniref:class I SAM-dependent methyltransferase n=1 Tax=Novispirillum itersonii TaxID=189 RepID=UPI0003822B49|nr:SAM-dependent methyltransferase [Novispirillum itersonii]
MTVLSPEALQVDLRRMIAETGPLPLATVMAAAARTYYAQGRAFGADGDFITAPEISQVFGELIGLWLAVVWQQMGQPAPLRLVEFGPGRGVLMADALRAAGRVPGFLASVDLHLIEQSRSLRDEQKTRLTGISGLSGCTWHDDLSTVPEGPALMVGNEFIDALPIEQYVHDGSVWRQRCVDWSEAEQAFGFVPGAEVDPVQVAALGPAFADPAPGQLAEVCLAGQQVAAALAARLAAQGGAALLIDYGYADSAPGDTLQALRHHQPVPALQTPGAVDITAHVDFARLATAAEAAGAKAWGPMTQGRFLAALGAEQRARILMRTATPQQAVQISSGVHRLIHPMKMGTLFKVLVLADPALPCPPGFEALA